MYTFSCFQRAPGIEPCGGDGVFVLDSNMGPKWRLVGTRDPTIIHLPQGINKVTVLDKEDEETGCKYMQIEFKEGKSPLPDGKLKYTTLFSNDELLQSLCRTYHGSERNKAAGRGRGGRGRGGRGRGGRGGGRGRGRGKR